MASLAGAVGCFAENEFPKNRTTSATSPKVAPRQQSHSPYQSRPASSLRTKPPVSGSIRELAEKQAGNNGRRRSLLGSGRDILKRRSLLQRGDSVSSVASATASSTDQLNGISTTHPQRRSLPVDSMFNKTSTATLNAQAAPLQIATDIAVDDGESICRSPTWDEDRSRRSRSTWNWRKSSVPNMKTEDEIVEPVKQPKKLNKKPPAAMETQRHSAAIADSGAVTDGPAVKKRRSSSSSLTHAMRGFISRRSSRTLSPDRSRPSSALAFRSSSKGPKPIEIYPEDALERAAKEDDDYVNDLAEFGTEMEASVRASWTGPERKMSKSKLAKQSSAPITLDTPPQSRGQETAAIAVPASRPGVPRSTSVPAPFSRFFGKKDNAAGGYKYPEINKRLVKNPPPVPTKSQPDPWRRPANNLRTQSTTDLSTSGSGFRGGYVQRQRILNQQRSIARFNDEVAVKTAYDSFMAEPQMPPTPPVSTESVHTTQSSKSLQEIAKPSPEGSGSVESQVKRRTSQIEVARQVPLQAVYVNGTAKTVSVGNESASKLTSQASKVKLQQQVQKRSSVQGLITQGFMTEDHTTKSEPTPVKAVQQKPQIVKISQRRSFNPFSRSESRSQDRSRPAPVTIQPTQQQETARRTSSVSKSPDLAQVEVQRQSNDLPAASSASLTRASSTSVRSRKLSPTYQLPSLSTSPISPIFGVFPDEPSGMASNDNTVRLIPPVDVKTAPTRPLPSTPVLAPQPELLIASENAEGIIRKTSVKRHRSDPELKVPEVKIEPPAHPAPPSFDFLPELKHQPLQKPKRTSQVGVIPGSPSTPRSPSQFPLPPQTEVSRRSGGRMSKRTSYAPSTVTKGGPPKPVAKMFVICCHCKFWHDLPSKIYEAMALPQSVSKEDDITVPINDKKTGKDDSTPKSEVKGLEGKIFTQVKCPWCEHGMSTNCCQGWTAVIYLHERHH